MKKIDVEELKKIQIDILNEVDKFCKNNNINYWLDCGTLLGAVRHKGYIPWDDDIDLGMLRDDYNRFIKTFNQENSKYKLECYENNNKFYYFFGKVLDTSTVLYEPDEKGIKLSVNIDVFVYDNAPDDNKKLKRMFRKRNFYRRMRNIRLFNKTSYDNNFIKKIARLIANKLLFFIPKDYFVKKTIKNAQKYNKFETKRVGNFVDIDAVAINKKVFSSFINMQFEKNKYPVPAGYDELLKAYYGDYMKLPPIEKRVSNHSFVAYKDEKKIKNEKNN